MKKLAIVCFFAVLVVPGFAQKAERYCLVNIRFRNNRVDVYLDLGNAAKLTPYKDTTLKSKMLLAKNYSTTIDVLNYMASLDWTLVNTLHNLQNGSVEGYTFLLKRTFDITEFEAGPQAIKNSQ